MAPMPPKQPVSGAQSASGTPAQGYTAQPDPRRAPVDFTNQESFAQDVDASPYASVKSAKRAAKALGKRPAPAAAAAEGSAQRPVQGDAAQQPTPPVAIPGAMPIRSQMHVVVGGAHQSQTRPSASGQAPRAKRAATGRVAKGGDVKTPQTPTPLEPGKQDPEQFPAEKQYVEAAERAAQARPAASRANIARPKPCPASSAAKQGAPDTAASGKQPPKQPRRMPSFSLAQYDTEEFMRRAALGVTCLACVVVTCLTLYTPAQHLYSAMRENERLTDELAQNQARVEALQKSVSALQTPEGVQDMAHKTWGLVMPDEVPLTVENATYTPADTPIPAEVKRGSGKNTSTWVTDVLDQVFGQAGSTTATTSDESVATLSETGTTTQVTSALPVQD